MRRSREKVRGEIPDIRSPMTKRRSDVLDMVLVIGLSGNRACNHFCVSRAGSVICC